MFEYYTICNYELSYHIKIIRIRKKYVNIIKSYKNTMVKVTQKWYEVMEHYDWRILLCKSYFYRSFVVKKRTFMQLYLVMSRLKSWVIQGSQTFNNQFSLIYIYFLSNFLLYILIQPKHSLVCASLILEPQAFWFLGLIGGGHRVIWCLHLKIIDSKINCFSFDPKNKIKMKKFCSIS